MTSVTSLPPARTSQDSGEARLSTRLRVESADLIPVSRRLAAYNLAYLAAVYGVALGFIAIFWAHPAWYTFVLGFIVVSSRQQALLNCEHECVHRKFLPSLALNNFVGRYLCAAPVGSPFGVARARHLAHHRLLATPEDPDKGLHDGSPPKDTPLGLVRYFVHGLLGGYALMVLFGPKEGAIAPGPDSTRRDLLSILISQAVIAVALSALFAWWVYPALWLAPLASVTALSHLVRSFVEHAITDSETRDHSNRLITIRSNLVERAVLSPYFMNYHAEHHLLPSVPAPRLRELSRTLADRDDLPPILIRKSYGGAIRGYFRALRSR
jgi:fatty acid desaturase